MTIKHLSHILFISLATLLLGSCSDVESYSDLLNAEEKATNWYLAQRKVEISIPADSVFQVGEDAPFYKMDKDGYLYMQVINVGDMNDRPKLGDLVYFRYMRQNIKYLYEGYDITPEGNGDNLNSSSVGPTSFLFGEKYLATSTQYGTGIQEPLKFFGYNSEVNLVLRSYYGFSSDQSQCNPYIINIKYFKAEY